MEPGSDNKESEQQTASQTVLERLAQNATTEVDIPVVVPSRKRTSKQVKGMASKRQKVEDSDDESVYEEDKEIDSSDGDDEDDSIIAPDDEVEVESEELPEDTEESAEKLAKVLESEAQRFIKKPLESVNVNGRSLRNRASIKKPDDSHQKLIASAFTLDEKKELIKELGIWRRKLASEAAEKNVVFPHLDVRMPLEFIQDEHRKVRIALNLESSDDESSDPESEEDSEADIDSDTSDSDCETETEEE